MFELSSVGFSVARSVSSLQLLPAGTELHACARAPSMCCLQVLLQAVAALLALKECELRELLAEEDLCSLKSILGAQPDCLVRAMRSPCFASAARIWRGHAPRAQSPLRRRRASAAQRGGGG